MGQDTTNRAERRRTQKALDKLESRIDDPAVQTAALVTINRAIAVLRKDFGFGDGRVQKFIEGMGGGEPQPKACITPQLLREALE